MSAASFAGGRQRRQRPTLSARCLATAVSPLAALALALGPFCTLTFTASAQRTESGQPTGEVNAAGKAAAPMATELPPEVRQLLVGVTEDWNSSRGTLWRFERQNRANSPGSGSGSANDATQSAGVKDRSSAKVAARPEPPRAHSAAAWTRLTKPSGVDILLGRNGLAWGRGALQIPQALLDRHATAKREGDRRAPAGCFAIPKIFGDDPALPDRATFPYRQVSRWDAWPDDPANPFYNRHVVIDPKKGVPSWFEKQRMRQGDPAYRWLVEVRHNSDPPQPGAGSAIFFHVRRGPDRTTAGCTTMSEGNLSAIVQWLMAEASPHYVLLPRAEYELLQPIWKLPALPPA